MMESEKRIFYRKLWGLVFPIAIQNLMTALVSASDAFMLGFVSQTSLSAVSLATQIQFVHKRRFWQSFLKFLWLYQLYFL